MSFGEALRRQGYLGTRHNIYSDHRSIHSRSVRLLQSAHQKGGQVATARRYGQQVGRNYLSHASSSIIAPETLDTCALKAAILRAVGGTQRGKAATSAQRAAILPLLQELETRNPTPQPVRSLALSGVWALLYQAPLDEARAATDRSGTTEGPFLAAFQPLTRDIVRTRGNLQLIDLDARRAENLAEFTLGGRWEGALNIIGTAAPQPTAQGSPSDTRVDVTFSRFELRVGSAVRLRVPLDWIKPKGWIETTYLDEDLRIGRGDKGSIFVASRVKDSRWRGAGM